VGFAVLVLLAEVVVRRFFSTPRLRKPAVAPAARPVEATAGVVSSATTSAPPPRQDAPQAPAAAATSEPQEPPAPEKPSGGVDSALEAARARSRKRLGR
jgi:hypothetical protein